MKKEREQREIDLLLWKSGELDPVKVKHLENNLSQEDLDFIQTLDSQDQLFNNIKSSPEPTLAPFVIRSDSPPLRQFQNVKFVLSSLVLIILFVAALIWNPIAPTKKPVISDNKDHPGTVEKSELPDIANSSRNKIKNTTQSKYRKRYLSLRYRHRRMARLNLIYRPKNST